MENLKKSNELLEAIIDGTAFDKETGLIWEHWVNAIIKQIDLNNIELRGSEETSHESAALPLHGVSGSLLSDEDIDSTFPITDDMPERGKTYNAGKRLGAKWMRKKLVGQ